MKIVLGIIAVLILVALAGVYGYQKIGDVRPALLPSSGQITQQFEQQKQLSTANGEPVDIPLKTATGFKIGLFAKDLGKARGMTFSPGGVLLVSSMSGQGEIVALPDKNDDSIADSHQTVLSNLNNTHGLVFFNNQLFVTEETKVSRYNWDEQNLKATLDKELFDLPEPGGHFTRTIVFDKSGKMYVSLGSTCNVCNEKHPFFASVIVSDANGAAPKLYAKGLRNSVALAIDPTTQELWGAENGRDLLGDGLPPEEINIIKEGKDYGWPFCYGDRVADTSYSAEATTRCPQTEPMIYGMPAHNAPLGMAFIPENFKSDWKDDLVVALHGSWNRSVPDGYKVVRLKKEGNNITGMEDLLTGFIQGRSADGRPVDVIFDKKGHLFVSDDKAGNIYIVSGI